MENYSDRLKSFYKRWVPFYKFFNIRMKSNYRAAMPLVLEKIIINNKTTILDVGTGTGALAGILLNYSSNITGIDFSQEMLREAEKKYGQKINFINMEAHEISRFKPDSFDLLTTAFCLHDMSDKYRYNVLEEMKRVSKEKVVIFDFPNNVKNPAVLFIEYLEGSCYKDFSKSINNQLTTIFPKVETINYGTVNNLSQI